MAGLLRRSEIRALGSFAAESGARVWIVGGTLRDLLLGRPTSEVDVAVEADAESIARRLETAGYGRSVVLSTEAPRVYRVAGSRELDLAELEGGSIEQDLARRDFTVNAIAFELAARLWSDPFGGLRDLAAGRLRIVRARNLREDPLRVLRAARLYATHGLKPDRPTTRACRNEAKRLDTVAPERIRSELVKLLDAPRVTPSLSWAQRVGAFKPALGLQTLRAPATVLRRMDADPIRRALPGGRRRVRLALLAEGAGLTPEQAARWLASLRFSKRESGGVARLVELAGKARATVDVRQAWSWVRDAGDDWRDALALLRVSGSAHERTAARLARLSRRRRPRLSVRGGDVMRWLGGPTGPRIGALLRDLEVEILRGAIRNRSQARAWVRRRAASARSSPPAGYNLST